MKPVHTETLTGSDEAGRWSYSASVTEKDIVLELDGVSYFFRTDQWRSLCWMIARAREQYIELDARLTAEYGPKIQGRYGFV